MEIIPLLIGVILFFSGSMALMFAATGGSGESNSSFGNKFFNIKSSAAVVYGFGAYAFIVVMTFYYISNDQDEVIAAKNKEIDVMKLHIKSLDEIAFNCDSSMRKMSIEFYDGKVVSIFNGKTLVKYSSYKDSLEFTGLIGVSRIKKGPFKSLKLNTEPGTKYYLQDEDSVIWGFNILEAGRSLTAEIYKN